MNVILSVGVLIISGYILGELFEKINLPKISGYIIAGILLNPDLTGVISPYFIKHTDPLLSISLAFITFSIGGSLSLKNLRSSGKTVLWLTAAESFFAFGVVFIFIFLGLYFFFHIFNTPYVIIAVSLVLASLAAPTDPSATLAVIHEYKAKGKVTDTMLEIAAFDDIFGLIIYTLVTAFAAFFLGNTDINFGVKTLELLGDISGSLLIGGLVGLLFNGLVKLFKKQHEGTLIVLTFGLILIAFGTSEYFGFESLLTTITLGMVVVNSNPLAKKIFKLIERYTDELIFVIFFTLSGLHLQLSALTGSLLLILIYILARFIGKYMGIYTASTLLKANPKIKKYTAGGLVPQGGIVVGLALLLTREEIFANAASMIIGLVIGAALIHEIIGPVISRYALKKAGEIK